MFNSLVRGRAPHWLGKYAVTENSYNGLTSYRVPGVDHATIGYALDARASIIVPQVETVEQAQQIVSAAKFGACIGGKRSAPPGRRIPDVSMQCCNPNLSFWENQNSQAAIIIQVESLEGINNLDAILKAVGEHIDSVWLGKLGLSRFYGIARVLG